MNQIKNLRKAHIPKMSQEKLGLLVGVGRSTVAMWECGKSEPDNATLAKLSEIFSVSIDYVLGRDSKKNHGVKVPVLGDVAAGIPIEAITDILDYEEIDLELAKTGEYFGLRVKGKSMEPRMKEGDVVIVRRQESADTGDTVVVLVNGDSATVKKIKYGPDGITLLPTNPVFDPLFYTCAEVKDLPVRVIGRVVELRAKF